MASKSELAFGKVDQLEQRAIPIRRVPLSDQTQLPADYSATPGGTLFSTTPGGEQLSDSLTDISCHFWLKR